MKIRPLGAEVFHGGLQKKDGHDEANSRFPQFAKAHTNQQNALCVRTDS
jgi:hypothetical protein